MQRTLDIVFNPISDDLYNESKRVKKSLEDVSNQAKSTADAVDKLDDALDDAANSAKKMDNAGSGVSNSFKKTEDQAKKLADKYKNLGDTAGDVGARTGQLKGVLGAFGSGAEGAANTVMDLADAGEAALKSFAALGPVAIAVGAAVAALGAAYMVYAREQDQAKESAEQAKVSFIALDNAQRTLQMSLIDLSEATGHLTSLQAEEARIDAQLEQQIQDLARAAYEEDAAKNKQIASNIKMRDTISLLMSPLMMISEAMLFAAKAGTYLAEMFGVSEEYAVKHRAALDKQFDSVQSYLGVAGKAVDAIAGWSDENEHLADSIDAGTKSTNDQVSALTAEADARKKTAQARDQEVKSTQAKVSADKKAAEAEKELVQSGAEIIKQSIEKNKLLADTQAITDSLAASVEGFYEPAIEGETKHAKAIRDTQAEYDKLREKIQEQIAANLEAGMSVEDLTSLEIQLTQEKVDKISAINQEQADEKKKLDQEVAEAEKELNKEVNQQIIESFADMTSQLSSLTEDRLSETMDALAEIDELQSELNEKEINASQLKGEALVQAYKDGEVAAEDLSERQKDFINTVLNAEENALKQKEKKQRAAAIAGFLANKASALSGVVMNTAQAVMAAQVIPPPAGQILAGVVAATGAVQFGIVAAEKPSFASGVANYRPDAVDATLHAGESVLNTRATNMLGEQQVNELNQGRPMGGSTDVTAAVYLDGRLFDAQSVKARKRLGSTMNKASRPNRLGMNSKRIG